MRLIQALEQASEQSDTQMVQRPGPHGNVTMSKQTVAIRDIAIGIAQRHYSFAKMARIIQDPSTPDEIWDMAMKVLETDIKPFTDFVASTPAFFSALEEAQATQALNMRRLSRLVSLSANWTIRTSG